MSPKTLHRPVGPIHTRTESLRQSVSPAAYDCLRIVVVRSGSAILLSEFRARPVSFGDIVLLGTNVLCGFEPEEPVMFTTLFLDRDYLVDQVFWKYSAMLSDRLETREWLESRYVEPAQILRPGSALIERIVPWIDELEAMSAAGLGAEKFYRAQSLLFALFDIAAPYLRVSSTRLSPTQRTAARTDHPRRRQFCPLRAEARKGAALMTQDPGLHWTLKALAEKVHLSASQFSRVFADAYGKTPLVYLTMLRAERLAHLLRETALPIEVAMHQVGWHSRGHGARLFKQYVGVSPAQYRLISVTSGPSVVDSNISTPENDLRT